MWRRFAAWWQDWCASLFPQSLRFYTDDAAALRADWEAVAGDMRRAMQQLEREHPEMFRTTEQKASES